MGKIEQERLYKAYMANSKNDKLLKIVRDNAFSYAKQILESYPEFEDKPEVVKVEEKVEVKPKSKKEKK